MRLIAIIILSVFLMPCLIAKHHVGVFCATDEKVPDLYKDAAFEFGHALALSGYGLVTGGGNSGLMKAVVNGFIQEDTSNLKGVIPSVFKDMNVHHPKIPEENLRWTDTIHERLRTFQNECDTVVVLPGGIGTLQELMDFMVPKQLGLLKQRIILFNVDCYWDFLLMQFKVMVEKNALKQTHLALLTVVSNMKECMKAIAAEEASDHQGLNERYWEKDN